MRLSARFVFAAALLAGAQATSAAPADDVRALLARGQPKAALAAADRALTTEPRDIPLRLLRARAQQALGQRADARTTLRDLAQEFPSEPEPLADLAALQAADGQWQPAEASLRAALALQPGDAALQERLGDVLLQRARAAYRESAALEPANTRPAQKAARIAAALPAAPAASAVPAAPAQSPKRP